MRRPSILKNYAYNLSYEFFLYFIPFVTIPYISRILGAEQLGRYSFAQSIVSCFILVAVFGTPAYGQRTIAQLRNDNGPRNTAFWELVLLRILTTAACLIVYALVVLPLCGDIPLFAVASIELVSVFFDISWFYKGEENFAVICLTNTLCQAVGMALIFAFVKRPDDLNLYILFYTGGLLAANLLQWFFLKKYHTLVPRPAALHPFRHMRPVFTLFAANAAVQVYAILDKTMLGIIARDNAQNGYYDQAQKIARVLVALVTAIGPVVVSRTASMWKTENEDQIPLLILRSSRLVYALGFPALFGIILIASRFVPVFYGPGYEGVTPLLRVLSLLLIFIGTSNVIGTQYMVPTGKEKLFTRSLTLGAIVNFCLNAVLIRHFQAMGAAVASVIAECFVALVQIFFVRHELPFGKMLHLAVRYGLLAAGMFACGVVFSHFLPGSAVGLLLLIVMCIGVYLAELVLLRDPALRRDAFDL